MGETNILRALLNIREAGDYDLARFYSIQRARRSAENRVNSVGAALEYFVKDAFCSTFREPQLQRKGIEYAKCFSYIGNQNNPPDIMLKGSDAVEVKKIDGVRPSDLALNSSYPKSKLHSDSPMITAACRACEPWQVKDMLYSVGFVAGTRLKALVFVYGDCYAASRGVYERVRRSVTEGLKGLDLEMAKTRELGRVNRVDPLGITNLRVRGMWTIQNPLRVFSHLFNYAPGRGLTAYALMRKDKYASFPEGDRKAAASRLGKEEAKIKDPDNPARMLDAVLLKFNTG